jgi:uncharacterized protein (TIGR03435 family)
MTFTLLRSRFSVRVQLFGVLFGVLSGAGGSAQAPAFDAVSIKVNTSGDRGSRFGGRPGGLNATNNTLRNLIRNIYNVSAAQIVGGPDWIGIDRFDIVATAAGSPARDLLIAMAKTMLGDRFKLRVRMETRPVPIYALVLARADGRLGPTLRPSKMVCNAQTPGGPPPEPPTPLGGQDVPVCGTSMNAGTLRSGGIDLDQLARRLTDAVERIVVNKTGLTGAFDLVLTAGTPGATPTENTASMFTAVQEQLGLKLEPQTGPADVLAIEHAEKPTEN